jgi:hypothetical protein
VFNRWDCDMFNRRYLPRYSDLVGGGTWTF